MNTNFYSIIFALVVLGSVLFGRSSDNAETLAKANVLMNERNAVESAATDASAIALPEIKENDDENIYGDLLAEKGKLQEEPTGINAVAALVAEIGSPYPLYQKGESLVWPIASLTKLMTAVVARETLSREREIVITDTAVAAEGDVGQFRASERFMTEDLIRAMLTVSSNDAAFALAEFYGAPLFLDRMRARAAEIELSETIFADPTGISPGNRSTVKDFRRFAEYLFIHHPDFFAMSTMPQTTITELTTHSVRELKNINFFSGRPGFLGGKTGFTNEANGNLLSLFDIRGRKFIIIVFGTPDRFAETTKLFNWIQTKI